MFKKSLVIVAFLLTAITVINGQQVSVGPVDTSMKIAWDLPTNVPLADAPSFSYRFYDSVTGTSHLVLSSVTCTAGTPVTCSTQITQALADSLNKVGVHNLTLSLFRQDVGESSKSLPFSLQSPAGVPTGLKIIR